MATHTAVSAQHATLAASTMDTVTLSGAGARVVIKNRQTSVDSFIYATINGADPTVGADDTIVIPGGETYATPGGDHYGANPAGADVVVKLISATADPYTVMLENR